MKNLIKSGVRDIKSQSTKRRQRIKTNDGLVDFMRWNGKKYKGTKAEQRKKCRAFINREEEKAITSLIAKIKYISAAGDFERLVVTLEWSRSFNAKASTNKGFNGSSTGGGGYCKGSTALAQALNSDLSLMKLLYSKKNKAIPTQKQTYYEQNGIETDSEQGFNFSLFGYGSGYGILPYFECGVGISSHQRIIESLCLTFEHITSTKYMDVYIIGRQD